VNDQIVTSLLQTYGATGAVLVAAGIALKALYAHLREVQEKRIQDAQAATAKLLEVVQHEHEQNAMLIRAIDGNADAIREVRMMLEGSLGNRTAPRLPPAPPPSPRR
jgi:dihydrodipicolinate synthase/N-acetylneuraminate lyase